MNTAKSMGLKGTVSTLRTEFAEWDAAVRAWKQPRPMSMTHFRPDGQPSEVEYYNPGGEVSRIVNDYDSSGRVLQSRSRNGTAKESVAVNEYDSAGRLTRVYTIEPGGKQRDTETFTYDEAGRKAAKIFLDVDGNEGGMTTSSSVEVYDADDTVEQSAYDRKGRLLGRETITRNAAGKVTRVERRLGDLSFPNLEALPLQERETMMTQLSQFLGPALVMVTIECKYDDAGRRTERLVQMARLLEQCTTFQYDEHGNVIDETTAGKQREAQHSDSGETQLTNETPQATRTHYDYAYDDHGNWTERTQSVANDGSSPLTRANVERREISYYSVP